MLKQAYSEPLVAAQTPEVRQPALRLVDGGLPKAITNRNERRMRRERRAAEGQFRTMTGWRIGTW
jgi:hypothetical protein